jgi:hypothetical protein
MEPVLPNRKRASRADLQQHSWVESVQILNTGSEATAQAHSRGSSLLTSAGAAFP